MHDVAIVGYRPVETTLAGLPGRLGLMWWFLTRIVQSVRCHRQLDSIMMRYEFFSV